MRWTGAGLGRALRLMERFHSTPDDGIALTAIAAQFRGRDQPRWPMHARGPADRELLDAATGLKTIAAGGTLVLEDVSRRRAAALAAHVRNVADAERHE